MRLFLTLIPTILVWFLALLFGIMIGERSSKEPIIKEQNKIKCSGYTVLDNQRVILCNGDTINYKWQYRYGSN